MIKKEETVEPHKIFEALRDPQRAAILKALRRKGEMSFTELMKTIDVASGRLAFQLSKLGSLIEKSEEKYKLSPLGQGSLKIFDVAEALLHAPDHWWIAPLVYNWRTKECVWDEEVKAVNSMMSEIDEFPEWALQVRDAMPRYGFEMCSHRWLDGLDHVIEMIEAEEFHPSNAGHCGDVPGRIVHAAEQRATAVQSWIEEVTPRDELGMQVADWLGKPTPEKKEAARCYVELIRAYFLKSEDHGNALSARWRARADENEILKLMFQGALGEGLDGLLQNRCGFKIIDRLDLYIRIIGGDHSQLADRHGVCNTQLRFVILDDQVRFVTTLGYLWGWQAYLLGKDEEWLRATKPNIAGAAIYALRGVSRAGKPTPLRRWLVASLLKSTKLWCQYALKNMPGDSVPAYARDLPDVIAAIEGQSDTGRTHSSICLTSKEGTR